ncbi:class 3 adenylate cyclase [Bradyrhizobium sp. R2.2-H]|jgi:class 3 adenylate cyclase|uniref:adenylate/guanylate cyclase domain-containing protein n=1 Tax=unclassified Bradyrhizobium TaxID=2631580 RepID=UPI00104DA2FB|nr:MULTISPECIES: adenylate/guanylate cyclase domain-containing protein [unclassified Bradyrhizobium]TCU63966.1 class 3 adenylate cyclase [Bradyrhizobium sp. Y-H1]TCU65945.1 class 3 adenylate cyclase [Bradyrhizobium sp. R2.2-H]
MHIERFRYLAPAAALAIGIFLVDTLSSLQFAVASLYTVVVLIVAQELHRGGTVVVGIVCALLTIISYILTHGLVANGTAALRSGVSLIALLVTTMLVLHRISANQRVKKVERERTNLARFFSPSIAEQLIKAQTPFSFTRCQRAAVLFVDIVGFTDFSSSRPPDVVVQTLRHHLRMFSDVVFSHQGSIDKFLGDGLMAVFGLPLASLRDATNAAECAIELLKSVDSWNGRIDAKDQSLRIAVGIHYGEVIHGDVGNEKKLELTLIGDTVNVASRVEAHCRILETSVLVTGEFMDALSAEDSVELAAAFRDEGSHILRGRRDPVRLFSIRRMSCDL